MTLRTIPAFLAFALLGRPVYGQDVVPLPRVGEVQPRHARSIGASRFAVGAETMDRNMTVYRHWRQYLGPLGVKKARIQSGWAKTEKTPGQYDWRWMDEIIPDMAAQGVKPWVCLSYGNPAYQGGGGAGLHAGMPKSPEALAAWDRYVAAFVERYGRYTDEWEIWNEPRVMEEYGELVLRTAAIVRARQPKARIMMAAGQAFDIAGTEKLLALLQSRGALDLVDEIAGHPYLINPDAAYLEDSPKSVIQLRRAIGRFSSRIIYRHGETGLPSRVNSFGMFGKETWLSEEIQAKWALRRLLSDLGHDVSTTSYFGICDMHYGRAVTAEDMMRPGVINAKGLLATNPDQTVHHVKPAYHAVQHITAIFDDTVRRIPDFQCPISGAAPDGRLSVFGYRGKKGGHIITLWRSGQRPGERTEWEYVTVTVPSGRFKNPVWVDMLTGRVCSLKGVMRKNGNQFIFTQIPIYDSVVLIAEGGEIPTRTVRSSKQVKQE